MRFTELRESGLGIEVDEIGRLFEPFVERHVEGEDADWDREIARRERKIVKKGRKRRFLGFLPGALRTKETVVQEYGSSWGPENFREYDLDGPRVRMTPWIWGDRRMIGSDVGGTRFRQLLLIRVIERVKPKRVLEVGCGNGINLILLASYFPEIEFCGVELTEEGTAAPRALQKEDRLPETLARYAPLGIRDDQAFKRIDFRQGDAAELPFEDGSFDLVYSILALEQMERIRQEALGHMARVAAKATFMFEPFREVNDEGWPKRYVYARNYFRGAIAELPRLGLEPEFAIKDFPQEIHLRAAAVLARKTGAPKSGR